MSPANTSEISIRQSKWTRLLFALLCLAPLLQLSAQLLIDDAHRNNTFALTGVIPLLAALCGFWRAAQLPRSERMPWVWSSIALLFWALGAIIDGLLANSSMQLTYDPAGFFYLSAGFPLMLSFSRSARTAALKSVIVLNTIQIVLAFVLVWFRPLRMPDSAHANGLSIFNMYSLECLLLAAFAILRLFTCVTAEERRHMFYINITLWLYIPVEFSIDYINIYKKIPVMGSHADLLWSIPFFVTGWLTLRAPIASSPQPRASGSLYRFRILETISPMIITAGIFALAASMILQHARVAFIIIFVLLIVQGAESAIVQLNYRSIQDLLLIQGDKLIAANADLERLTFLDPLTGIANRRHFDLALGAVWRQAVRRKDSLAILMIDLDFFKAVNDLHGHAYGDESLTRIAQLLSKQARRPSDLLARYGGDELILLLPETNADGARTVARRLQQIVADSNLVNQASPFENRITLSIGIGVCQPTRELSPTSLIKLADDALYESKKSGRNCITLHT